MHRRLWLSVAMLAAGASLLIAASLASAAGNHASAQAKKGGTWKYATSGSAGSRLVPEIAQRFTVSKSGKVYTFYLRKNFRFSDGKRVTAKNFAYAFKRTLSKSISSPGQSFIQDKASTFVTSYKAKGKFKFVVKLKKPSGLFLTEMAMPFFQATPLSLPANKQIGNVTSPAALPSAGPYHVGGYSIYYVSDPETAYLQTLHNQYDEGPIPPDQISSVQHQFGKNKSRFWVKPTVCTGYIPLNMARSNFKGNVSLRHAMNYGLNRRDYVKAPGPDSGIPWNHMLAPGLPGASLAQKLVGHLYPKKSNYKLARKLAKGHYKSHNLTIWFRSSGITGPKQKLLVDRDLRFLGYKESQLHFRGFPGVDIYDAIGHKGAQFDLATSVGWCQDYPDPYDFLNKLLTPLGIQKSNGDNWSFFNSKKWNTKMAKAARLTGNARTRAYGKLDAAITKGPAPFAAMRTYNNLYLLSSRVNKKCLVYQGVYQDWDIAAECFK